MNYFKIKEVTIFFSIFIVDIFDLFLDLYRFFISILLFRTFSLWFPHTKLYNAVCLSHKIYYLENRDKLIEGMKKYYHDNKKNKINISYDPITVKFS